MFNRYLICGLFDVAITAVLAHPHAALLIHVIGALRAHAVLAAFVVDQLFLFLVPEKNTARFVFELGSKRAVPAVARKAGMMVAALAGGAGVALGLALAAGLVRVMTTLLYGVSEHDPGTFSAVAVIMRHSLFEAVSTSAVPSASRTRR